MLSTKLGVRRSTELRVRSKWMWRIPERKKEVIKGFNGLEGFFLVDIIIFADELSVRVLTFITEQWYFSAGNWNDPFSYRMVDEDSFTIPGFARGVL